MDLKCRTLLKKTAWPGEGMQLLKNMGFKTAAMALRDDSVGIDNQTLQAEEKLAIFSEQRETGFPHRRLQIAIIQ